MGTITWPNMMAALVFLLVAITVPHVYGQDASFPGTMIINGGIQGSANVNTRSGDTVIAFNQTQAGEEVSRGSVADNQGTYSVSITLSSEFQGNILFFHYQKKDGGNIYELVESDQANANRVELPFQGGGFPFPNIVERDMFIGQLVSSGGGNGSNGGGGGSQRTYDVNGDGKVTKEDAALAARIKAGVTRGLPDSQISAADVNNDGVVDLQDIMDIMRHID